MTDFLRRHIAAQRLAPSGLRPDSTPSPSPAPPGQDAITKTYGKLARMFQDPEAFLDRIRSGEKGVRRMADAIMNNPEASAGMTEERFDDLVRVRNNVYDDPDDDEFLRWGMSLRENELEFVAEMGNMTSSRMQSFVRNSRLVFGGPSALNVNSAEVVKVAKTHLRFESEGTANRTAYTFAKEMSQANLSPVQRARDFVAFCSGVRKHKDIEEIRRDVIPSQREPEDAGFSM